MRRLYGLVAQALIVAMVWVPFSAQSAMVGTDEAVAAHDYGGRAAVSAFLSCSDIVRQLEAMGVSAATAQERVAAMTQDEVNQLAGRIASAPAGGSVAWVLVIVVVIVYLVWHKT